MAERVRSSRELHDLIGHHLTTLSLNLEVASHVSDGKAKAHVDKAQALARLLLSDVRAVVSRLREGESLDLAEALQLVLAGLRLGARGYLLKDVSLDQLVSAVRALVEGRTLLQPAVTERLLQSLRQREVPRQDALAYAEALTERETEVIRLMAGGYSNKEIARALGLSEGTVKNHVSTILSKFGVRDRTRAVLKALEQGVV
jgi:DNA-binding NarL/FixJ family response regulator